MRDGYEKDKDFIKLSHPKVAGGTILTSMENSVQHAATQQKTPAPPVAGGFAMRVGHWVHEHKHTPESALGFTGYHFLRSAAASVPYGLSMAATWWGLEKATAASKTLAESASWAKNIGSGMQWFFSSTPIRLSAIIGTSFTLYRGTSKLGKWTREYLFNPADSEQTTIQKVQDYPSELWGKMKEIAPAEAASTPVAAVALGFIGSTFAHDAFAAIKKTGLRADYLQAASEGKGLARLAEVGWSNKFGFGRHWVTNIIGYSVFFEVGDRLFKDRQIKRGIWQGDHHTTTGKKSESDVGGATLWTEHAKEGRKYPESALEAKPDHQRFGFMTTEPSVARFVFRRVVPTAIGIGLYTGFKFRNAYQLLGDYPKGLDMAKNIPSQALKEGAATSLFFFVPWATEPWEKIYDKFFDSLQHKRDGKPVEGEQKATPDIQHNNEKLLDKLREKDRGAGVPVG